MFNGCAGVLKCFPKNVRITVTAEVQDRIKLGMHGLSLIAQGNAIYCIRRMEFKEGMHVTVISYFYQSCAYRNYYNKPIMYSCFDMNIN